MARVYSQPDVAAFIAGLNRAGAVARRGVFGGTLVGAVASLVGAGGVSVNITVPHGLSAPPGIVGASAIGWAGIVFESAPPDATNIYLTAEVLTGTFTSATPYSYRWWATV